MKKSKKGSLGQQVNVIVRDKKFVFMALKKCGSVTLHKTVLDSLGYKDLSGKNINRVIRNDLAWTGDKHEIAELVDYIKISWVRNPFDRLVSGWMHRVRNNNDAKGYGISPKASFEDFINHICSVEDENLNVHFRQQTSFIAIQGKLVPDILIHLENLQEEWEQLRSKFNWLSSIRWHEQKTKGPGKYRKHYNKDLIEKVRHRFEEDLDLLEYDF